MVLYALVTRLVQSSETATEQLPGRAQYQLIKCWARWKAAQKTVVWLGCPVVIPPPHGGRPRWREPVGISLLDLERGRDGSSRRAFSGPTVQQDRSRPISRTRSHSLTIFRWPSPTARSSRSSIAPREGSSTHSVLRRLASCMDSDAPAWRASPALWCQRTFRVAYRASPGARSPRSDAQRTPYPAPMRRRRPGP